MVSLGWFLDSCHPKYGTSLKTISIVRPFALPFVFRSTPVRFTPNECTQMHTFSFVHPQCGYVINCKLFHTFVVDSWSARLVFWHSLQVWLASVHTLRVLLPCAFLAVLYCSGAIVSPAGAHGSRWWCTQIVWSEKFSSSTISGRVSSKSPAALPKKAT